MLSIVVAYGVNRGIGYRGELPWRLPSDLRRFRELTLGGTVVMGRRTYESLPPAYRPLPGRRNVVVSSSAGYVHPDVEVHASLESALAAHGDDCFVIGGGSIYAQALPRAQRIYATLVQASPPSDTFFPELPPAEWRHSAQGEEAFENGHRFRFATYDRIRRPLHRSPPMTASADPLYHLPAARGEDQLRQMRRLEAERVCVFCREHVEEAHREPVDMYGEHWYVTKNDYPYKGTKAHYLIVSNLHVHSFDDLPDEAGAELWALKRRLKRQLAPLATATIERSGDIRYNGGSVAHLHVHFVALSADPEQTVRFKVSRDPGDPH